MLQWIKDHLTHAAVGSALALLMPLVQAHTSVPLPSSATLMAVFAAVAAAHGVKAMLTAAWGAGKGYLATLVGKIV